MQGIRSVTDAMAGHFSSVEAIRGSCGRYWDMGRTHLEAARLTQVTIWLWIEKSQTATVGISSPSAVGKVGKSKNASLFLFVSAQRLSLDILLKINLPCFQYLFLTSFPVLKTTVLLANYPSWPKQVRQGDLLDDCPSEKVWDKKQQRSIARE